MTVEQLIKLLQTMPKDVIVYRDGGEYADDWRRVTSVSNLNSWGTKGVLIE
jgi:hypothetical protein